MALSNVWQRTKKLSYYSKFGLISVLLVALLFMVGTAFDFGASLFFDTWWLNVLPVPFIIARVLASACYIGVEIDLFKKKDKEEDDKNKYERWGTGIGILLGITLGVIMDIFNPAGTNCIKITQSILLVCNSININGSLANRITSCHDPDRRLAHEKYFIRASALLGLALSITLLITASAAAVSIFGVTSFFTAGALPITIASIFFVANITSQMASTGDYIAKTISYFYAHYFHQAGRNDEIKGRVDAKKYEYAGATLGVGVALLTAAVIITALALTQPHLFIGAVGIVAAGFIITTCVSVIVGIISRIGRWYDNYCDISKTENNEISYLQLPSQLDISSSLSHHSQTLIRSRGYSWPLSSKQCSSMPGPAQSIAIADGKAAQSTSLKSKVAHFSFLAPAPCPSKNKNPLVNQSKSTIMQRSSSF